MHRLLHVCVSAECYQGRSPLLFAELSPEGKSLAVSLPSFPLFGKCCLSRWGSAGNEWLPLSTSGVSTWGDGTTRKGRLGTGHGPLVSLTVGLWETQSKGCLCVANEWIEPGVPSLWPCDNPRCPDSSTLCVEISSRTVGLPRGWGLPPTSVLLSPGPGNMLHKAEQLQEQVRCCSTGLRADLHQSSHFPDYADTFHSRGALTYMWPPVSYWKGLIWKLTWRWDHGQIWVQTVLWTLWLSFSADRRGWEIETLWGKDLNCWGLHQVAKFLLLNL